MLYRHGKISRYSVPAGFSDLAFPFFFSAWENSPFFFSTWENLQLPQLKLSGGWLGSFEWIKLACHLERADSSVGT